MLFHIPSYLSPLASSSGTGIHNYCFPYRCRIIKTLLLRMIRRERRVLGIRTDLWELSRRGLAFAGE